MLKFINLQVVGSVHENVAFLIMHQSLDLPKRVLTLYHREIQAGEYEVIISALLPPYPLCACVRACACVCVCVCVCVGGGIK